MAEFFVRKRKMALPAIALGGYALLAMIPVTARVTLGSSTAPMVSMFLATLCVGRQS